MKNKIIILVVNLLIVAPFNGYAQQYTGSEIFRKADSAVIEKVGRDVFNKYFTYDKYTYYEFKDKNGEHNWATLRRGKTKGQFVNLRFRYDFSLNINHSSPLNFEVQFDNKLNIISTIDTSYIPRYVLHNKPSDVLTEAVVLSRSKTLFKQKGVKSIQATLKFDYEKHTYVWEIDNFFYQETDFDGHRIGNMEVLEFDAFTGEKVGYYPNRRFGVVH